MQSLEHRALAQTARTQFKEGQRSMARCIRVTCIPDITQISAFPGLPSGWSLELEGQTGRNLCDGTGARYHVPSSLPRIRLLPKSVPS
jgi:hypothetical protein